MNSLLHPRVRVQWGNQFVGKNASFRNPFRNEAKCYHRKDHAGHIHAALPVTETAFAKRRLTLSRPNLARSAHVLAVAAVTTAEGSVREFFVREAEEDDLEQVAEVVFEAFNTFCASIGQGAPFEEDQIQDFLFVVGDLHSHPDKRLQVAVAQEEGREGDIIGMCGLSLMDGVASVVMTAVSTPSSRRGVGRELMESVIGICEQESKSGTVSLKMDLANHAAFALYMSVGFNVVDVCTFLEGCVSDSAADEAIGAVEEAGTIFRLMEEKDVPVCNALYMKAVGHSRLKNIREVLDMPGPQPCIVAVRLNDSGEEELLAYCTTYTLFGHSVAVDEQHFIALVSYGSKISKSEGLGGIVIQCRPRVNPNVVQWALRSGLRVKSQNLWMERGKLTSIDPHFVYGVGLDA